MKKGLLIGLVVLGLLVIAGMALAVDTTTSTANPTPTGEQIKCCNHNYVDANNDGLCDVCGMKLTDLTAKKGGCCGGCSGCGGHHGK